MAVETVVRGGAASLLDAATRRRVAARVRAALRALGRARSSATLVFTDDPEIRALNREYRAHDRATDVLSFHLQELAGEDDPAGNGIALGDIVISVETALRRSGRRRLPAELERLAVHGLCHLFGHDHQKPAQAALMFRLERRLRRLPLPGRVARSARSGLFPVRKTAPPSGLRTTRPAAAAAARGSWGARPARRPAAVTGR